MIRLALAVTLISCNVGERASSTTQPTALDPRALALHTQLFAAADKGDVAHFKQLLSVKSVALVDNHLRKMSALPRPVGETEMVWADFVALHRAIPARDRRVAPYKVVREGENWRLDITGAADSDFFNWEARRP